MSRGVGCRSFLGVVLCLVWGLRGEGRSLDSARIFSLEECLVYACEYSARALEARHQFLASHWRYQSYRAQFFPSLRLQGSLPDFNRRLVRYQLVDGSYRYVLENANSLSLGSELLQRLSLTGSQLYVRSSLERVDIFGAGRRTSYLSVPVQIGLQHDFFALNTLKWEKRIEPQRYEEAKRGYVQALERIALEAIELYFGQLYAQQHFAIAQLNERNADTLYRIAKGRYNIGTIAENELLQMELNYLNALHAVNEGAVQLQMALFRLQAYLGLREHQEWVVASPPLPERLDSVSYGEMLALAQLRNPGLMGKQRGVVEAERGVAKARGELGYSARLSLSYGLTQQAPDVLSVYSTPQDQQGVRLGISIPLLDWGLGRGRLRIAQSEYELARIQSEAYAQTFAQDLFLQVMRYNLLGNQVALLAKADTIAQNRYQVTKSRFLIGKVDVLDLDKAQADRDAAGMAYVRAVHSYWQVYYSLRAAALYDPLRRIPLEVDFEQLLR